MVLESSGVSRLGFEKWDLADEFVALAHEVN